MPNPHDELVAELVAALERYTMAVAALGKSPPGRKDNYFEAPLSAGGAIERWQELDRAGKVAHAVLAKAKEAQ